MKQALNSPVGKFILATAGFALTFVIAYGTISRSAGQAEKQIEVNTKSIENIQTFQLPAIRGDIAVLKVIDERNSTNYQNIKESLDEMKAMLIDFQRSQNRSAKIIQPR